MTRDVAAALRSCVVCGCTEADACSPTPCSWELGAPSLCSVCAEFLLNVRRIRRVFAFLLACGIKRGRRELLVAIGRIAPARQRRRR